MQAELASDLAFQPPPPINSGEASVPFFIRCATSGHPLLIETPTSKTKHQAVSRLSQPPAVLKRLGLCVRWEHEAAHRHSFSLTCVEALTARLVKAPFSAVPPVGDQPMTRRRDATTRGAIASSE